jgi:surface protein
VSNVTNMTDMFENANSLSDLNKCAIHTSFSTNDAWPYDWSEFCPVFQPQTTAELQTAVDMWVDDNATALATYGEINTWDVSLITDMNSLFEDKTTFNDDISNWDVSSVTNMGNMFHTASSFNGDISTWDVSSVTFMGGMFASAGSNNYVFNQDISHWKHPKMKYPD